MSPSRLSARWLAAGIMAVAVATVVGITIGPVAISPWRAVAELIDHIPGVRLDSGLTNTEATIVWQIRFPRVVRGLLVGAMLAVGGASYQGAFRNPLVDPYLLGSAAGAGLGATLAIVAGASATGGFLSPLSLAAFTGGLGAVALTYVLGASAGADRSTASLVLGGVAVTSFLTAIQTYVQQQNSDVIREVYTWILGRLTATGWADIGPLAFYVAISSAVLIAHRRALDVLSLGDDEAYGLGVSVVAVRRTVVVAATLGTAAAVSVSGLIAFVGLIVPHTIRLAGARGYRIIVPMSLFFGGAFLALADLLARTLAAPSELPIGVVTAFFGAPFFFVVLRTSRSRA